jgi:hypothetical protein
MGGVRSSRAARAALLAALATPLSAAAAAWKVDLDRSTFAVLTHRDGVAARLAHDHLIVARGAQCDLELDTAAPAAARLACRQPVLALDVDPAAERARFAPRLVLLGALDGDLPPVAEGDRAEIRAAMLGARQLFAERFPEIRVELLELSPRGGGGGANARVALGWDARLRLTLRGETVETTAPVRFEIDGDRLTAELLAELRFTDFRITPYRAALGAVRNTDLFHLYVDLAARRDSP